MNTASTTLKYWERDCEGYARNGEDFVLNNVATEEHRAFCDELCRKYNYSFELLENDKRRFTPKK